MSLPVQYFQGPWKTTAQHVLTFTYDGVDYDVTIAADTEYDSMNALLWDIRDKLEDTGPVDIFWFYVLSDGRCKIESKGLVFGLAEVTTATYGILDWMKMTAAPYVGVQTITGSECHYRGFYPELSLVESQIFTRSANPVRATYRALNGGTVHATTLTPVDTRGGFISARLKVQFEDLATEVTASQNLAFLIGFLTGYRTAATDINEGGAGLHAVWEGSISDALELDGLPIGGASETRFTLVDEWLDPDDYASAAAYETAHVTSEIYLHPDTKELPIVPEYAGYGDVWVFEIIVFKEGR